MARRKKTSAAEDWIEIVARLPWWAGVALAVVFYVVLHRLAAQQVVTAVQPGQLGDMMTQTLWKSFAAVGQYLLPFICLVGAGMSAWRRHERKDLCPNACKHGRGRARRHELAGVRAAGRRGLSAAGLRGDRDGRGGADGGVDLVLRKGREKFLVQCKQWRAFKVGVAVVRELYGVMAAKGAAGGFVVTSGSFTEEAIEFASGRNVTLVDGPKLFGLIRQAQGAGLQPACAGLGAFSRSAVARAARTSRVESAHMSRLREGNDQTNGQTRRECRWRVLGLHRVSGVQRCSACGGRTNSVKARSTAAFAERT